MAPSTATGAVAAPQPAWTPGARVGAYSLLAKLATGGMAEIWLARQQGLKGFERMVVVKRIIESLSADPAFVEMFLDEARIAAQLAHPNIVQIFDLGEHAGAYYLAMEYLPGEHLAAVARAAAKAGRPLSFQTSVQLGIDALDGLGHAHTRRGVDGQPLNVVHRDVSPQNILITIDGQLKLVDFGIARAANRSTQTQGNQVKGKFAYMPPEQARSEALDGRADLFSVGAILYELLSHQRLWQIKDQVQLLTALIDPAPIQPLHERAPQVPLELSAIVMKALSKSPGARWKDAASFKAALEGWLRANGGAPSKTELSELMHRLFADRIRARAELLEQASRGNFAAASDAPPVRPPTDRSGSMPGGTPVPPGERASRRSVILALAAAALVGAVGAGGIALLDRGPSATTVTEMKPGAPADLPGVEPPPQPGRGPAQERTPPPEPAAPKPSELAVETEPAGAAVFLDGEERGRAPLTLGGLAPGTYQLEARLEGYEPLKRAVAVKGPGEKSTLVLPLVPEPAKRTPATAAPVPRGKLSLSTEPWTRVTLKGKSLGDTPLLELPLPAGRHRLRLVNEQAKIDVAIEVEVKAGQTTKKVLKF